MSRQGQESFATGDIDLIDRASAATGPIRHTTGVRYYRWAAVTRTGESSDGVCCVHTSRFNDQSPVAWCTPAHRRAAVCLRPLRRGRQTKLDRSEADDTTMAPWHAAAVAVPTTHCQHFIISYHMPVRLRRTVSSIFPAYMSGAVGCLSCTVKGL